MTTIRIDQDAFSKATHMMHGSLQAYIDTKIHPLVRSRIWPRIVVRGHYARTGDNVLVSPLEKRDKRFNWHRPTAAVVMEGKGGSQDAITLEICCFPGRDYVQHYALLIASHLALRGITATMSAVEYIPPSREQCIDLFLQSNLRWMGQVDTVVLGYVDYLASTDPPVAWETGTDAPDQFFAWKQFHRDDGSVVAFVGSMMSLWGDIIGNLVRVLRQLNGVSRVLYMGKAGSLRPQDPPNEVLATGNVSHMDCTVRSWKSTLDGTLANITAIPNLSHGVHVTVPTPLVETDAWFAQWEDRAQWVDCEVGHLVEACQADGIQFAYLHFISDNVARHYPQSLATERDGVVLQARQRVLDTMRRVLADYLCLEVLRSSPSRLGIHEPVPTAAAPGDAEDLNGSRT
ncbi:hypothetical protein NUU61_005385 [Penicillium alfredii]|uniref:Uncharacterized protein n=1 Tax=Penicillium alfredii TaxID=1506179 RepID=A0A9W9K7J2_9EURO|nr:uncharacterized protein NUU61_005385 [Penicillium alfredii]KAJ5096029.1 hypothetical protein NUU61_005385 [Penicillium alfredii]